MNKTKIKILNAARKLFNASGYSNVTIRMIAQELGMSSGNLNYHFKKREDILEALYFEMVSVFDARVEQLGEREINFKNIKSDILTSMERMIEYRFFWTDLYHILQLNDNIKHHFEKVYHDRSKGYEFLLKALSKLDYLNSFESEKEQELIIERMLGLSNTWIYNSILYDKEITSSYIELQTESLMFMLYPYLTEIGKTEFKKVVLLV
ncbi:TetR/AcrR family transcriptional regulator [Brumimicrobium aurantiacum]|uniref:TetR/AcrR family transcriptional regulator n=1 Tax=Brumimicrobium aurantiacum TaxID=1737063 RepID=A0A3E1EWV1_9FLAO|nr:TetR/AcrR family transcriptional regulator [Brumimicrobium aurantiacum]RFC54027.1 TetR/AcrR family transcriptional regulator [Brumimicrobium aurantiacum]